MSAADRAIDDAFRKDIRRAADWGRTADLHEQAKHLAATWVGYNAEDVGTSSPPIYAAVMLSRAYCDAEARVAALEEALRKIAESNGDFTLAGKIARAALMVEGGDE